MGAYPIGEEVLIMKERSKNIALVHPNYVGWHILEMSKHYMYDLYYNIFKKEFGDNVSLLYSDTDSFLLKFENVNIYEKMAAGEVLYDYVDSSNFNENYSLFTNDKKGMLGLLKSETGSF